MSHEMTPRPPVDFPKPRHEIDYLVLIVVVVAIVLLLCLAG